MPMTGPPPTRIRIVSHEGVSRTEVKIMLEMIVDVHRLAALGLRKEFSESVELSVRQTSLLGKSIGHIGSRLTPVEAYPCLERYVNCLA